MYFTGFGTAAVLYGSWVVVKHYLLGYPYLFNGGHKIAWQKMFGGESPHAVVGGGHGAHGHSSHELEQQHQHSASQHPPHSAAGEIKH